LPTVKVNDINISYSVTGNGEPLLLIMGLNAPQSGWNDQVPFFKKHYQVITYDNRGVGKSDKPKGPYTIRLMAEDVVGLLNRLDIKKAHVVGISMGGMIAQELAINHPEKVMKLILASTYAYQDRDSSGATEEMNQAVQYPDKFLTTLVSLAFNQRLRRFLTVLLARVLSRFANPSKKVENETAFVAQLRACSEHNTLDRLSLIKAPTLVIVGTADRVIKPSSSDVIAARIPHSKLVKIKNGSHVLNMETKNIFNQTVLSFLTSDTNNPL
jgi:3-oxoadipate enol-lactonase